MKILAKRNGIALVAVLAILLVLTLLLPVMFSLSERASIAAMEGTDKERASYLARTMIEMSVAAFQNVYDDADDFDELSASEQADVSNADLKNAKDIMNEFIGVENNPPAHPDITSDKLYMYVYDNDSAPAGEKIELPKKPAASATQAQKDQYKIDFQKYKEKYVKYSTVEPVADKAEFDGHKYKYLGHSECKIHYNRDTKYYKTMPDGVTLPATYEEYKANKKEVEDFLYHNSGNSADLENKPQFFKIDNKQVEFNSKGFVNGKVGTRHCILVLPTKPSETNWLVATETNGHQIFPNTQYASGVRAIEYNHKIGTAEVALKQPFYVFSCVGNMVISPDKMKLRNDDGTLSDYTYPYGKGTMSMNLHPATSTVKPENDPMFACLKTNNMTRWADDARKDNFVAFTSTNAMQIDMPIKLLVNPCRTGRIGDGLSPNRALYKVMYFQSPTIVFNRGVDSLVSLYCKNLPIFTTHNAYRMTSIVLGAPQSTPYSYHHENARYNRTVKAGKVIFAEDVYLWVIPFAENGSNYRFQTVYYKGKDISIYKFANAGDVFYYNNEVETTIHGHKQRAGFSLTGYFMDVLYNQKAVNTTHWWEPWEAMQNAIFNGLLNGINRGSPMYVKEDLKWVGNLYSGSGSKPAAIDDFYVVWDS